MSRILERLTARVVIEWYGFARTRGGFFDLWGPCEPEPRMRAEHGVLTATGGLCVPWGASTVPTWDPWRAWHPPLPPLRMPTLRASRGGIRFIEPSMAQLPPSNLPPLPNLPPLLRGQSPSWRRRRR